MALQVKNTKELIHPDKFKWKVLIFGLSGSGKTTWLSDAPNLGVAACETGEGNGLLSVASKGIDYVEPKTYQELEQIASGVVFKDKDSIAGDSLTDMSHTLVKDYALTIPRTGGNSLKRAMGMPEQDDYGTMAELTRRLVRKFLDLDKHVIFTAGLRIQEPNPETGQGQFLVGPNLPGQMFLGSCAMFDTVMCLKIRQKMRDPKDPKSKYTERYFVTAGDGKGLIAKCRAVIEGMPPLLEAEEVFVPKDQDPEGVGIGTFPVLLKKITEKYAEFYEKNKGVKK